MSAASWLILADDLTGAADSAVAFAARGVPTEVGWNGRRPAPGPAPRVFAYDGESRALSAEAAASLRADQVATLLGPDARLFVKIDSTLRGQPAAEIRATLQASRALRPSALGIVAPAFPATGRTTLDGRVLVGGRPLELAEAWRRDHSYPTADIPAVLASEGLDATRLPLSVVRAGGGALGRALAGAGALVVCDAVGDPDLDRIVRAGLSLERPVFWVGAGGLAAALARAAAEPAPAATPAPASRRGVLVVTGSPATASRVAAARLAATEGVLHAPVEARDLLSGTAPPLPAALAETLEAGGDALINLLPEPSVDLRQGPRIARALGARLEPLAGSFGALAVTGGETAAALLSPLGIDGVRLADELEPGVALGVTLGGLEVPIATKSGAFGDAAVFVRILERLRRIKREGRVG